MSTDTRNPLILLVEDSEDDAFFFGRALEKSGIPCSLAHVMDGAQAIEFLGQASSSKASLPLAIFLDLKMPVLNGFEFLEWMRTQTFAGQIPIFVLSGSEQEKDKERAAALGANAYLVKPAKAGDLQRLLRDVCPQETGARA